MIGKGSEDVIASGGDRRVSKERGTQQQTYKTVSKGIGGESIFPKEGFEKI